MTCASLKVSNIDGAGDESNEVVFPFTIEYGVKPPYQYQPPARFDQGDTPLALVPFWQVLFPVGGQVRLKVTLDRQPETRSSRSSLSATAAPPMPPSGRNLLCRIR